MMPTALLTSGSTMWRNFSNEQVLKFLGILFRSRLTALTIHALSSITLQRYSDPYLLKSALTWMHSQQIEDGSFADGSDATLNERIETTSFILTCLSDVQHDDIVSMSFKLITDVINIDSNHFIVQQVLFQVSSAAQRFLERELAANHEMKTVVPMATAILLSHSSAWPQTVLKLDSVYDQLMDCYSSNRQGKLQR